MDRPEFVSVPVRGRVLRIRPAAIAYLQTDFEGMAVITFIGGETLTAQIAPAELEQLAEGRAPDAQKRRNAA